MNELVAFVPWINLALNIVILPLFSTMLDVKNRVTRLEALREYEVQQRSK